MKKCDDGYSHVQDMDMNNIIYRPTKQESLSYYNMVSNYKIKKSLKMRSKQWNSM